MIDISLSGKNAIVTGAAGGLGAACAQRLAQAGANVVLADIDREKAEKVSERIARLGVKSAAVKVDVTNEEDVISLIEREIRELGNLDIMVNTAGIGMMKPLVDFTKEEISRVLDINLKGTLLCCKHALKRMIPQKSGKIVNFSSCGAKTATPGCSVYAATKAGIIAVTNTLAKEVAEHNINVNAVSPGMVRTAMWENQLAQFTGNGSVADKDKVFNSWIGGSIPLKRPQEPEDIANMVLYLCSDFGRNITGQTINVDGGAVMY